MLILEYKSLSLCSIWLIQFVSTTYTIVLASTRMSVYNLYCLINFDMAAERMTLWQRQHRNLRRESFWEIFILEALIINYVISCIDGYKGSSSRLFSMKVQKSILDALTISKIVVISKNDVAKNTLQKGYFE